MGPLTYVRGSERIWRCSLARSAYRVAGCVWGSERTWRCSLARSDYLGCGLCVGSGRPRGGLYQAHAAKHVFEGGYAAGVEVGEDVLDAAGGVDDYDGSLRFAFVGVPEAECFGGVAVEIGDEWERVVVAFMEFCVGAEPVVFMP